MKKKFISLLTAFSMTLMLLTGVPISVSAEVVASGYCGKYNDEDISWSLDSNGVLTISGEGEMKKFTYDENAPWKGSNVKRAIIESGVTTIGENAFFGCSELVSVEIPDTVTHIKMCAFMDCHKLKLDRLPESVWYIGSQAFQGCYSLETLDMPGVFTIENDAFAGCSTGQVNDMDITLCTGLKAVNMPEAVYIESSAFSWCFNLETVNAPKVTILKSSVFAKCRMLSSVEIPKVKTIQKYAFTDCYRLLSFEIPPNVKVESKAFDGMSSSVIYYHESCTVQPDSFPNVRAEVKYTVTDGETELEIVKAGTYSHVNFPETIGGGKVVSANWEEFLTDDYPKRELTHDGEHNVDEDLICRICGDGSGEHNHTYEWQTDELYHWKVCTKCNEEDTRAEHKWNGGIVTTEPTEENEGVKTYTCTICGRTRTGSIDDPDHTHSLIYHQRELNFDEADGYGHESYWTCAGCSKIFLDEDGKYEINEIPKHDFPNEWKVVDYAAHYKNCTKCGSLIQFPHLWNDGDVTTEPTEEAEGVKTFTCKVCEAEKTEPIDKLEHTHVWSDTYQNDDDQHWKFCTKCTEADTKSNHTWDGGTVTTEPTEETEGVKTFTCTLCEAEKTEPIGKLEHTHVWSDTYQHDADGHWKFCTKCTEADTKSNHTWDSGTVTTEPTEETEGVKTYTCTVCSGTRTESVEMLAHTHKYSNEWTSNDTSHWHAATCGHDVISGEAVHTEDNGTVTVSATYENAGVKTFACSVCGYKMRTETIPQLEEEHTHNFSTDWTKDSTNHWHECDCGEISELSVHISSGWIVETPATADMEGVQIKICTVCEAELDRTSIDKLSNSGAGKPPAPSTPPSGSTTPVSPSVPVVTPTVTETATKTEDEVISDEPYVEDVSSAAGIYENDGSDSNIHYVLIVIFTAVAGISIIAAKKRFGKRKIK